MKTAVNSRPKNVAPPPPKRRAKTKNALVVHQPRAAVTVKATSSADLLAIIANAAANPRCNPEKMRALLDMRKEIEDEAARRAFTEAFILLQADLPVIDAKGKIVIDPKAGKRGQKTPYATYNEIHRVTKPILKAHGFALWAEPDIGGDGKIIMRGHLDHVKGHSKTCAMSLPLETSGSKNNVQGVGSSISYGRRYCAITLLNIVSHAPEDRDDDGAAAGGEPEKPEVISPESLAELTAAIEDCGVGIETFCNKYTIEKIADLPVAMLAEAMGSCRRFKENKQQGARA